MSCTLETAEIYDNIIRLLDELSPRLESIGKSDFADWLKFHPIIMALTGRECDESVIDMELYDPILVACEVFSHELLELLLQCEFPLYQYQSRGPLYTALECRDPEMFNILLLAEAPVDEAGGCMTLAVRNGPYYVKSLLGKSPFEVKHIALAEKHQKGFLLEDTLSMIYSEMENNETDE